MNTTAGLPLPLKGLVKQSLSSYETREQRDIESTSELWDEFVSVALQEIGSLLMPYADWKTALNQLAKLFRDRAEELHLTLNIEVENGCRVSTEWCYIHHVNSDAPMWGQTGRFPRVGDGRPSETKPYLVDAPGGEIEAETINDALALSLIHSRRAA